MSVDRDLVDATVTRCLVHLAADQNVLFLPTPGIAKSGEHDRHPGTLGLSADTLLATLPDAGASVARAGVERLVFLNGHGGNTALLDIAARDLRISHDMIVATGSWFGFAEFEGVFDPEALDDDIHAGDGETSAMLAARPELVDTSQARNFVSATREWKEANRHVGLTGRPARPAWISDDLDADGACGDASAATAEKSRHLPETAARNLALFPAEFARLEPRRRS